MKLLVLKSYAKLNLVLDVVGKRPDGFHELRTIFERIDLHDTIRLSSRTDGYIKLTCSNPQVPTGPKNLAVRIARQLQHDFQISSGVDIDIQKRIPMAAGLAGGSSNGATVLMGLNRLWHLKLSQKQLLQYAASLGSDVSFFIYNASFALGTGRGEQIQILPIPAKMWHVVVTPRVKMYTKDVFGILAQSRAASKMGLTSHKDNVNILLPFLRKGMLSQIGPVLANDLEPAILSLRPDFVRIKQKFIDAGAAGVCFSGSGPSVYAVAHNQKHAEQIRQAFDRRYTQVFVVHTI